MYLIIAIVVILMVALVFWGDFRRWLADTIRAIGLLIASVLPEVFAWIGNALRFIARVIGIYSITLACIAVFALVMIITALLIGAPIFTGIAFVLSLVLILLAWLPAGVILRVFRVTKAVVPKGIKAFVAWTAFIGFVAMIFPDEFTFRTLLGASLIALILLGTSVKINALDKIIFPLVMTMVLIIGWQHFFPDDFRSTTRYLVSWGKRANTVKDRGSINNETDAATTYAVLLKDVNVLYKLSEPKEPKAPRTIASEVDKSLSQGMIVKLVSHKQEVEEIDGQGFIQIQLPNAKGTYVKGEKYWVEAEFVRTATPREIVPKNIEPAAAQPVSAVTPPAVRDSIFPKGVYIIDVKGVTPYNIVIAASHNGCAMYSLSSDAYNYEIVFSDGEVVRGNGGVVAYRAKPKFRLASGSGDKVTLTVS